MKEDHGAMKFIGKHVVARFPVCHILCYHSVMLQNILLYLVMRGILF